MRTNLSRFTVSFSDLAWESVLGGTDVPMFPQAWQVGRYLETYTERYLSDQVVRLGCEVVHAVREVVGGRRDGLCSGCRGGILFFRDSCPLHG